MGQMGFVLYSLCHRNKQNVFFQQFDLVETVTQYGAGRDKEYTRCETRRGLKNLPNHCRGLKYMYSFMERRGPTFEPRKIPNSW